MQSVPRALLPELVTRALVDGGLHRACSLLLSPFSALGSEGWISSSTGFDAAAPHPTPIVLVHGLFGHAAGFRVLGRFLLARGFHNLATFSYAPRVDHDELARGLGRAIDAVCETTGAAEVDVVGHSLGGLAARHLLERSARARVRRVVTLGAPCLGRALPAGELALFGATDGIVPAPRRLRGRSAIVIGCGHLGLLFHPAVLHQVAAFLGQVDEERPAAALRAVA